MMSKIAVNVLFTLFALSAGATADGRADAVDKPLVLSKSATADEQNKLKALLNDDDAVDKLVDGLMSTLANKLAVRMPLVSAGRMPLPSAGFPSLAQPAFSNRKCVCPQATYEVKQPKPIGINFKNSRDGIVVSSVDKNADPRVKVGDKLVAVSASFGGEIWPAKSYQQSMMALNTRIGLVYMKLESTGGQTSRFGKKATGPVTEYVCLDCGWAYLESSDVTPFAKLPGSFVCPQCASSKRRFARKDPITGEIKQEIDAQAIVQAATVVVGLGVVFGLGYIASQ